MGDRRQSRYAGSANALDFATLDGSKVVPLAAYANSSTLADFVAGNNVKLGTNGSATPAAVTLTSPTTTVDSLYMTGNSALYFGSGMVGVAQSGNLLVVTSGAILCNAATGTFGISNQPTIGQAAVIGSTSNGDNTSGPTYQGRITSGNGLDLIVNAAGNLRINAIITDNGGASIGLTKNGSGLLDLSDGNAQNQPTNGNPGISEIANTYTGPTTINAGTLLVNDDQNLGAVPAVFNPASIVLNGGTLLTTRGFSFSAHRGITVGTQGGTLSYDGGSTWTIAQTITGPGGLTVAAVPGGYSATLSNTIALQSTPGANDYQGPTTLITAKASGTAKIVWNADDQIPDTSALMLVGDPNAAAGGGVNFRNHAETVGSLASAAGVGTILNLGAFTTGANGLSTSYGGTISGSGSFTKIGAGIQTLAGMASYSGATNIDGGALSVTGTLRSAGQVNVGNAANSLGGALGGAARSTHRSSSTAWDGLPPRSPRPRAP